MAIKNHSQFLLGKILKASIYLKTQSLESDPKIPYKKLNHKVINFSHLKV